MADPGYAVIGPGYVGRRLLERLAATGEPVAAIGRRPPGDVAGVETRAADLDDPASLAGLDLGGRTVFYLVPPDNGDERDHRMAHFLLAIGAADARPRRIVYMSTSGVYGDCGGQRVDESRPPAPATDRARRRLSAETQLAEYARRTGVESVILRVAGIYGPGRLPLERIRRGEPVICPDQATPSNRIHVDDLVSACLAAGEKGRSGGIYNCCDDRASSMTDYIYRVADAAGLERPACIGMAEAEDRLPPMLLSFLRESRRLVNDRLHGELGVELAFPTLEEGIPAALRERP